MTAKHLLSEIVAGLDGVTPGLVERLRDLVPQRVSVGMLRKERKAAR